MATVKQLRDRWKQEPGKTILEKIKAYLRETANTGPTTPGDILSAFLAGLPYRDEVPLGRDFRGCQTGSVFGDHYLEGYDFTYADLEDASFYRCNLIGAKFDHTHGVHTMHHLLTKASFRKVKFRQCYFLQVQAQECCFDKADLKETQFDESDLTGSSFRDANCKNVSFEDAILVGCDFRGADLTGAVFSGAKLDASTDFRGATLTNARWESKRPGGPAVDWRIARHDATTVVGTNPALTAIEDIKAIRIAIEAGYLDEKDPQTARLDQILQDLLTELPKKYLPDWEEEVVRRMGEEHRESVEYALSLGYKYMDLVD